MFAAVRTIAQAVWRHPVGSAAILYGLQLVIDRMEKHLSSKK